MPTIPAAMLKQIYRRGSLLNTAGGWCFTMRNHLATAHLNGLALTCDGLAIDPADVSIVQAGAAPIALATVGGETPLRFPVGVDTIVQVDGPPLAPGPHTLAVRADTRELGQVTIPVQDTVG